MIRVEITDLAYDGAKADETILRPVFIKTYHGTGPLLGQGQDLTKFNEWPASSVVPELTLEIEDRHINPEKYETNPEAAEQKMFLMDVLCACYNHPDGEVKVTRG